MLSVSAVTPCGCTWKWASPEFLFWKAPENMLHTAVGYMWATVKKKWESCSAATSCSCVASRSAEPAAVFEKLVSISQWIFLFSLYDASEKKSWRCCLRHQAPLQSGCFCGSQHQDATAWIKETREEIWGCFCFSFQRLDVIRGTIQVDLWF